MTAGVTMRMAGRARASRLQGAPLADATVSQKVETRLTLWLWREDRPADGNKSLSMRLGESFSCPKA